MGISLETLNLVNIFIKNSNSSSDKIKTNIEGTIHAMAMTVEMRDPYTAGHQRQVANLASAIARKYGYAQGTN